MKSTFVEYNNFDSTKIKNVTEFESNYHNICYCTPIYSYTSKSNYPLLIKTNFIDLTSDPFKYLKEDGKKYLSIDPNDISVSHLYKTLLDIAKFGSNYITNKHIEDQKETGPLLCNYSTGEKGKVDTGSIMKPIKLFFWEKNNKITSTIYNYNISKKYDTVDEYTSSEIKDLARFIFKGKQVRFIFEPRFWHCNGSYGTKLYIKYMEVKYKDQVIKSKLDSNQMEIYERITSVEI